MKCVPPCDTNYFKMFRLKVKNGYQKWNKSLFEDSSAEENSPAPKAVKDIMSKNIFSDRDLEKMNPDYSPSDLVLRMELRGSLVKDSHVHSTLKNKCQHKVKSVQDKNIKQLSKISREIAKIKSDLSATNIKNKIMMKHTRIKTKMSSKKQSLMPKNEKSFFEDEISYLSEFENTLNSNTETVFVTNDTCVEIPCNDNISKQSKIDNNIAGTNKIDVINLEEKTDPIKAIKSSDDVEDLQSAIALMTLYSPEDQDFKIFDDISPDSGKEDEIDKSANNLKIQAHKLSPKTLENTEKECLNICSLTNIAREKYLQNKYFYKWRNFIVIRKGMSELRKKTLNDFFEKLMNKKCELTKSNGKDTNKPKNKAQVIAHDQATYQHRYKVQKNIIALQKLKLEEQKRIIEELKYNKILETAKESTETMRDTLKNSYADMDHRIKPKIKTLTNELKLQEIEDPALALHCLKVPQFLQRMEKRAREREEKHAMIRERRRQMEEERLRLKQQAELAKVEMDKEEKAMRIKELKEKRKQEKIETIRRKQYADRMRALTVMADLHYERNLLIRCGLRPWRRLIELKRENAEKAQAHCQMLIKRNAFLHWMWYTEDMVIERNYIAEEFHKKKLTRKAFDAFKMSYHDLILKRQVADDYYDLHLQQLVLRKFRINVALLKKEEEAKMSKAVKYYESNLMFRVLSHWRVLPALERLQREREARKSRWRQKVLLVVPDYKPPED